MKWMAAVMVFLFCLVGMEIYRNMELVKASYTLQKLQSTRKNLEKENGHLKQKLSFSLSLRSLESRARGDLGLGSPQGMRFIREDLLHRESKSIPLSFRTWEGIKEMFSKLKNLLL